MFQVLWARHYQPGLTGSFHGDMAAAFDAISRDPDCDLQVAQMMRYASAVHMGIERDPRHEGRRWFCERFGTAAERAVLG